jgi:hypothetical protein
MVTFNYVRTERPLNKSVSGDVTVNANSCLKSSSTAKIIPRPPTVTSAFRFRSEERAIKRKEVSSYPCPIPLTVDIMALLKVTT